MTDKQKRMLKHWENKELQGCCKIIYCFMVDNELFSEILINGRKKSTYFVVAKNDYSSIIHKQLFDISKNKKDIKVIR